MRNLLASTQGTTSDACTDGTRVLNVGFYAYFEPLSYSADPDLNADGFNTHQGYEADLLTALEMMEGVGSLFTERLSLNGPASGSNPPHLRMI